MLYTCSIYLYIDGLNYISGRVDVTSLDECYISGWWVLHIRTTATYLDHRGYISGRVLHIWAMGVTYLDDCYISGPWRLHIRKDVTHLGDGCYISGRLLHIWTVRHKTQSRPLYRHLMCQRIKHIIHCSKYLREQWWFFYVIYVGSESLQIFWINCMCRAFYQIIA